MYSRIDLYYELYLSCFSNEASQETSRWSLVPVTFNDQTGHVLARDTNKKRRSQKRYQSAMQPDKNYNDDVTCK